MSGVTRPTNVVALDPEANALILQIAAARAQLAHDVAEKVGEELKNFKTEVRASLQINANLTAEAIHKLETAATTCERISGRLADRLTVLEGRALRTNSNEEIVISLAETQIAEQRLELERDRQELERDRDARKAAIEAAREEREEKRAERERRWGVVKMWSAASAGPAIVIALIALLSKAC
jgi:cell division GTPase FtsZ